MRMPRRWRMGWRCEEIGDLLDALLKVNSRLLALRVVSKCRGHFGRNVQEGVVRLRRS